MLTLKQKFFAENIHKGIQYNSTYRIAYYPDGMLVKRSGKQPRAAEIGRKVKTELKLIEHKLVAASLFDC